MEENTTVVETADTTPTVQEDTTTAEETVESVEATAETTIEADTENETAETTAIPEEEPVLTVKYNKQVRSLSREDAVSYAQKGMKYDSVIPMLESLKYVAAAEGKTLAEFVSAIRDQHDKNALEALVDRCNGDEELAKELFDVQKGKHQTAYENLIKAEQQAEQETEEAVTQRLADELAELRGEFPEISAYSDLPKSVLRDAEKKGISLLDSYLRFKHNEEKKAAEVKVQQATAAKASVGAQASTGGNEGTNPVIDAMMKGIWG